MKYYVKIVPNSSEESAIVKGDAIEVKVKAPAERNKANFAMLKLLRKQFDAPVRLIKGATSRKKIIEVMR